MSKQTNLLHAFRHPLVILSIVTLVLNDHILKVAAPSWLTGKLSDFAGLFFFPFLVGVVIQAAAGLHRESNASTPEASRRFLLTGILFTGIVFTAIKIVPAANLFVENALSGLLGGNVHIVRDPTDLLALVALLPAWKLGQRIERAQRSNPPGKLAYLVLGAGALASLATNPIPPPPSIQRLVPDGDILYASERLYEYDQVQGAYISRDGGNTWLWEEQIPAAIQQKLKEPLPKPLALCDPSFPQACYRIDGRPRVEESRDGGQTWQAGWELPAGREAYIERSATYQGLISFGGLKTPDFRAFDMAFFPGEGGSKVIVLMGNEGLLVHTANTGWQRTEMRLQKGDNILYNSPSPTRYYASSIAEAAQKTQPEWLLGLAVAYLVYLLTSAAAWTAVSFYVSPENKDRLGWGFSPSRILVILVVIAIGGWLLALAVKSLLWLLVSGVLSLVILVVSSMIWSRLSELVPRQNAYTRLAWAACALAVLAFLSIFTAFVLWAAGTITWYEQATTVAVVAVAIILIAGGYGIYRKTRQLMVPGKDLR